MIGEELRIDSEIADVEDTSADIDGRIVAHLHRRIRRRPFIEEEAIAMVEVGAQQKLPHIPELRRIFGANRSEEHTSELQSLMRISYAVFCLKKKKQKTSKQYHSYAIQPNHREQTQICQ